MCLQGCLHQTISIARTQGPYVAITFGEENIPKAIRTPYMLKNTIIDFLTELLLVANLLTESSLRKVPQTLTPGHDA